MKRWIPLAVTLLLAAWVLGFLRGPKDAAGEMPLRDFGSLPVVQSGRHQPLDSLARNSLLILRRKQTLNQEPWKGEFGKPKIVPAIDWMAELMFAPEKADTRPCFRIDNADLIGLLALTAGKNEELRSDGKHYSWNQIAPGMVRLKAEVQRASAIKADLRTAYDKGLVNLWEALSLYQTLRASTGPAATGNLTEGLAAFRAKFEESRSAFNAQMSGQPFDQAALDWVTPHLNAPLIVPTETLGGEWSRAIQVVGQPEPAYALSAYAAMASAYRAGDAAGFAKAVADYRARLESAGIHAKDLRKAPREQLLNHVEPFYRGMVISVLAFLLSVLVWFAPERFEWARRTAVWLMVLALVVMTVGLVARMFLEGRPPVTNLYSSALFIGWAAAALGLVLEAIWPRSIGVAVSSMLGFGTLMIAHFLSLDGDTMIMLRAVLDTNFWLATHVVIVTLGYAATFVAGILGIIYVVRGVFTRHVTKEMSKAFASMVFAIVCFATLFSFVGTVLGGIWADQSWGRFWGWDPKENGALIIVLWNALILHARMGGMVRERGLMNLAIFGNIVTSWSWFGTNMLGIGLHSYGFMGAAFWTLLGWVGFNLALIAIGLIPQRLWGSHRETAPASSSAPVPAA
jgi:ABC-type transport system involved in cytochrome c biogenesis permease subunit